MNSRLRISNPHDLLKHARKYQSRAASQGGRAMLVVFSPPAGWLEGFAEKHNVEYLDTVSVSDRSDRISALLGSERCAAIMQLGANPDLGLFAAVAGTVKTGGILILGTHSAPVVEPCAYGQFSSLSRNSSLSHSQQRLERIATKIAEDHPNTAGCVQVIHATDSTAAAQPIQTTATVCGDLRSCQSTTPNCHAAAEQDALLSQALHHLSENERSCLVIKGRRGRGKSSLLARLALQLDIAGLDFRITASHVSALDAFRQHAANTMTRYTSPEAACREPVDTLLVDEAANLSLSQLQQYLDAYQHVVLCTTVEGYEASGRAFDVRLLSELRTQSMALLQIEATQSWRWTDNDALELFTDQLIINKNTNAQDRVVQCTVENAQAHADQCQLSQVSQLDLIRDERLLTSLHRLLYTTHYQTTTKDLEHLLDAPTLQLWIHQLNDTVVGAIVLELEGIIPENLHSPILARTRRLPNQLLPQLLAQIANTSSALDRHYARIVRIAVHPKLRRQKLASELLEAVTAKYTDSTTSTSDSSTPIRVDAIGASFAADACSLGFWKSHGYIEFHRGYRLNPRTGKQAVAMLKSFEPSTTDVLSAASEIHQDNESARQRTTRHSTVLPTHHPYSVSVRDEQLLRRFAEGERSMHDTYAALRRLCAISGISMKRQSRQSTRQHELELRQFVQLWTGTQSTNQ